MSAIQLFEISLEHDIDEQYQYEPGETLRGAVLVELRQNVKIESVMLQIRGEGTVGWSEGGPGYAIRADETYIDTTQALVTSYGESKVFPKGHHEFPFEIELPPNIPSSFIGKFGSITYVVKATLKEDKRYGMGSTITSEPFLVLRNLDIANNPQLMKQIESTDSKRLWGNVIVCMSGKVTAHLKLNRVGHLPGEDIYMDAEITNSSPKVIKALQAAIVMNSTFHAQNRIKHNSQIVNKKRDDWEMSYGEGRRWKNVRLTIPPYIPESRLDGCDIIDINYELNFRVEISGGHDIRINIPIVVGTAKDEIERVIPMDAPEKEPNGNWKGAIDEVGNDELENGDINSSTKGRSKKGDPPVHAFRHPLPSGDTRVNPIFEEGSPRRRTDSEMVDQVFDFGEDADGGENRIYERIGSDREEPPFEIEEEADTRL